jgi:hypothetical protein
VARRHTFLSASAFLRVRIQHGEGHGLLALLEVAALKVHVGDESPHLIFITLKYRECRFDVGDIARAQPIAAIDQFVFNFAAAI